MLHENLKSLYTRVARPKRFMYREKKYINLLEVYADQTEDDVSKANALNGSLKSDVRMWKFVCVISVVISLYLIVIKLIH